jgi:tetratricopeptide (TPR) repeat protein
VRYARGAAAILLLAWALAPELSRYRAERLLFVGTQTLRYLLAHASEVKDPPAVLERVAAIALEASGGLPGDPRPWILAGGARLVKAELDLAIANYREALARGERAETDLNLGRAYEAQGDRRKSRAAFLRAVWISPALFSAVLPDVAATLWEDLARFEADLKAGRLKAPPPLP